jgi:hypothetical protein
MDLTQFALGLDAARAAFGTSAAPTAGTAVATLASGNLPAGTYDVCVFTRNLPTAGADEIPSTGGLEANMELRLGATVRQNRMKSTKQPGGVYEITDTQLDGSTALSVNATANAAASTVYSAVILVVRTS